MICGFVRQVTGVILFRNLWEKRAEKLCRINTPFVSNKFPELAFIYTSGYNRGRQFVENFVRASVVRFPNTRGLRV